MAEVIYNSLQYLTYADIQAMAVYLKSLAQGSPPAPATSDVPSSEGSLLLALGKTIYDNQCAVCHGAQGSENRPAFRRSRPVHQMGSAVMVLAAAIRPHGGQSMPQRTATAQSRCPRRGRGGRLHSHRMGARGTVSARDANALRSAPLD
jgi:cytochrome c5